MAYHTSNHVKSHSFDYFRNRSVANIVLETVGLYYPQETDKGQAIWINIGATANIRRVVG